LHSPATPISGSGLFATVSYQAAGAGTSTVSCDPLISDINGFAQPVNFSGTSVVVLLFATISGNATYQGRISHAGITVTAIGPVTRSSSTDENGDYTIEELRTGTYDVRAEASKYLPNCTSLSLASGDAATLPDTTLRGGNANSEDEIINIADATLVAANFNLSVPPADPMGDFNSDGIVNVQDLSILGSNYGLSGCQAW